MTLKEIVARWPRELIELVNGEADPDSLLFEPDDALYLDLFEYYLPDMPYGTAKARTGDPVEWILDAITREPMIQELLEDN